MKPNFKYKKLIESHIGISTAQHNDLIFQSGKKYLEYHYPQAKAGNNWITSKSFWTWFTIQWHCKCKEVFEICETVKLTKEEAAIIFGARSFEILKNYPCSSIIDNIFNDLQENKIQDLLKGTGVHIALSKTKNYEQT